MLKDIDYDELKKFLVSNNLLEEAVFSFPWKLKDYKDLLDDYNECLNNPESTYYLEDGKAVEVTGVYFWPNHFINSYSKNSQYLEIGIYLVKPRKNGTVYSLKTLYHTENWDRKAETYSAYKRDVANKIWETYIKDNVNKSGLDIFAVKVNKLKKEAEESNKMLKLAILLKEKLYNNKEG